MQPSSWAGAGGRSSCVLPPSGHTKGLLHVRSGLVWCGAVQSGMGWTEEKPPPLPKKKPKKNLYVADQRSSSSPTDERRIYPGANHPTQPPPEEVQRFQRSLPHRRLSSVPPAAGPANWKKKCIEPSCAHTTRSQIVLAVVGVVVGVVGVGDVVFASLGVSGLGASR